MLGGCPSSVSEMRAAAASAQAFTSPKKADALAGCIADGWSNTGPAEANVMNNRSERGWSVQHKSGAWIYGVADVTPAGGAAQVAYSGQFDRMTAQHLTVIRSCL